MTTICIGFSLTGLKIRRWSVAAWYGVNFNRVSFSFGFSHQDRHVGFSIDFCQAHNLASLLPPACPPLPCPNTSYLVSLVFFSRATAFPGPFFLPTHSSSRRFAWPSHLSLDLMSKPVRWQCPSDVLFDSRHERTEPCASFSYSQRAPLVIFSR